MAAEGYDHSMAFHPTDESKMRAWDDARRKIASGRVRSKSTNTIARVHRSVPIIDATRPGATTPDLRIVVYANTGYCGPVLFAADDIERA